MFDTNINILVVDDMMTMRKIVINGLKKIGYSRFVEADDGATAWPILEKSLTEGDKFDLIISDWNMPQLTGLELLKKVRATPDMAEIPFLMVTAEAEQKAVLEAVQEKVSNYIVKPFSPEVLKEKLELVYKKHYG